MAFKENLKTELEFKNWYAIENGAETRRLFRDTVNANIIEISYLLKKDDNNVNTNSILALSYNIDSLCNIFKNTKNVFFL